MNGGNKIIISVFINNLLPTKMTRAEWLAQLEECGGDLSQDELINLVFKDGPNALWSDTVKQMHVAYDGMYNYLTGFFPTRVWNDWQGTTELGKVYHSAYVPFDLGIFQRSMQICNPQSQNECHTDYCSIPRGGISNLPPFEMYKTGFKTEPMCIANIRTSSQAKQIAEFIVKERFGVDEQVMNMFYTMAVIRMLGHKWVLEYEIDSSGELQPIANVNPRNMLQGFDYSYLQPLFPQVSNVANIMPLELRFLDMFGRALVNSKNPNGVSTGKRGEPIFELWHAEDWYRQEIIDSPENIDRMKYTIPAPMLPGYTRAPNGTEKEVVGNFIMKQVPMLPRFAESTQGGLTVVQDMRNVPVDSGNQAIHNFREWDNAPFLLSLAVGKGIGEILTRPSISTGIEGRPILPISGNGDWQYRNDYDKVCNEDMNMPHFRKRFEMGFKQLNPDAGWGFISRAKKFRLRPVNACDLRPLFAVTPADSDCSILTIGCNPLKQRQSNNIITEDRVRSILCNSAMCGKDTIYRLTFDRENIDTITPNQNPLSCECGDPVQVIVNDEEGAFSRQMDATLVEYLRPNMINGAVYYVELEEALDEGECIVGVVCNDETPLSGRVIDCRDHGTDPSLATNKIRVTLDSLLYCGVGDTVSVEYFDSDGNSLGTAQGTIAIADTDKFVYTITKTSGTWNCDLYGEDQATMSVTCL